MRPLTGYFFDDYTLGQKFVHAIPRTLTTGDTALYLALTGSRNPLHCSEPFARSLGYPAAPVDDLLVFHIAFGKTVPDISWNAVANLGYAECRFVQPVFVGDTLRAESEIIGLKANSSGKTGVVTVRSNAFNQRDELVLTWARWVMVHRRGTHPHTDAPPPAFDAFVAPENLSAPYFAYTPDTPDAIAHATGSPKFWDDVVLNTPINHPGGMTIDETDHTLATRLYQNTARVHFDLHHMKDSRFGRRLVYGGQIISICRALSFDGLENALSIAAINGGAHVQPTFAGDTIYAVSTPLMKWPVNDSVGALRVQLDGYKNIDPNSTAFAGVTDGQKVLTLDYTVLMPRQN